jgi:hypothetical protein
MTLKFNTEPAFLTAIGSDSIGSGDAKLRLRSHLWQTIYSMLRRLYTSSEWTVEP